MCMYAGCKTRGRSGYTSRVATMCHALIYPPCLTSPYHRSIHQTSKLHTLYRMLSQAVLQANQNIAMYTTVAVEVLRMWLRSVVDDGKRNALKYLTQVTGTRQRLHNTVKACSIWLLLHVFSASRTCSGVGAVCLPCFLMAKLLLPCHVWLKQLLQS